MSLRRARPSMDDGFSVLEVAVAVGLIFSVVILLMYAGIVALVDVAHSRQRQGATGLANEALEQIRALPFASVALGMVTSDLEAAPDPNISRSGTAAPYTYTYRGESIPHGSHAAGAPVFPHRRTVTIEQTTYTVATYVTRFRNSLTNNTLRATTEVSWANPMRKGVMPKVEAQTILHPGGGCQSTALHPYSGPCLAFFDSIAQSQPGSISIEGWYLDEASNGMLRQVPVSLSMLLPTQRSTFKSEQVAQVQQVVEGSGMKLSFDGAPEATSGRFAVSTGADTDPSTTRGEFETRSITDTALPLVRGVANTVSAVPSTSGAGSASSAAAARLPGAPCYLGSVSEDDAQPCTAGDVSQPSSMQASLYVSRPAALGVVNLTALAPGAGGSAATQSGFADRSNAATAGCAGTVDGCARARATRSIGDLRIGGIPSLAAPTGWLGYLLRVDGLSEIVYAHSGRGVGPPGFTRSGALEWWNGNGYTTIDLASAAATTVTSTLSSSADGLSVDLNAVVSVDAPTATTSGPCVTTCDLTEATATSGSPMTGELAYRISVGTETVANFVIKIDLAEVSATSVYKAGS
jgi:Tfp pilus assembly protein PilV